MKTTKFLESIPTYKECEITTKSLGEGAFGEVKECNGSNFVLKTALPHKNSDGEMKQIMFKGEYDYMFDSSYSDEQKFEFVVRMYPVKKEKTPGCYDMFKVVMEKVTPLDGFLGINKEPYSTIRYDIATKLNELVKALHDELNYSHNDLKPDNIGIRENNGKKQLVLLDMGTSMKFNKQDKYRWFHIDNTNMKTYEKITPFTLEYANPGIYGELYHNHTHRDNWALACTLYRIITGESFYDNMSAPQITKKIFTFTTQKLNDYINEKKIDETWKKKLLDLMLPSITVYEETPSGQPTGTLGAGTVGGNKRNKRKAYKKTGGSESHDGKFEIDKDQQYHYAFHKNNTQQQDGKKNNQTILIHNIEAWKNEVRNIESSEEILFKKLIRTVTPQRIAKQLNRFTITDAEVHQGGSSIPSTQRKEITKEQYNKYKNSKIYTVRKYRIKDLTNKKENAYVYYKYKN